MNTLRTIFFSLLVLGILTTGCEDILDTDSDGLVFPDQNQLNTPNDTLYTMAGIMSNFTQLMDRYVLLGELRGELMALSDEASPALKEIYNFDVSADNPYNNIRDYYSVINHCNYLINNMDTAEVRRIDTTIIGGEIISIDTNVIYRSFGYPEFAQAKTIRAWTYLQAAINYGSVKYYDDAILSINQQEDYQELSLTELVPELIATLEPVKDIDLPGGYFNSNRLYLPTKLVLGELYLWNEQYENAANVFYNLIMEEEEVIYESYTSTWTVESGEFVEREFENQVWIQLIASSVEIMTRMIGSTENGQVNTLHSLSSNLVITPSNVALNNWNSQLYYYNAGTSIKGDLRGEYGSYYTAETDREFGRMVNDVDEIPDFRWLSGDEIMISKFELNYYEDFKIINLYRVGLLYLRFAEAINRTGRPNLAFAVLKNGLNSKTMAIDTLVPPHEKYVNPNDSIRSFISFANFEDVAYDYNVGVHARGCGNIHLSYDDYIIKEDESHTLNSLEDSIAFVEDKIIEELALETAFEGNRFGDLMRIAKRRNDPSYLANIVSEKYPDAAAMKGKLMIESSWYLPASDSLTD